ncbi:MAG: hypothetical protein NTX64_02275 [Elusimicrobia bacterium]|nr:hypothetical protein [Elusimicrobiota bacterium]
MRGLYVHQASPASLAVVWSDGISSTTYVSSGSLAIQAVVDTGKARVDIVEVDPFGVVYVTTGAESTYTPETAGISISSVSPATDIAAGTMMVDINGEGAQEISIGPDADGPSIAADIRAKVSTISASPEYANFTAVFTDDGRYLLTSGTSGYGSSVTVTNATGSITWNPFESFPSTGQLSIQEDKYWTWYFYNPGSLSHWQVSAANGLDIQLPTYSNCAVKTQSPGINSGSWRFELKTGSAASQGVGENVVILFYGTSDWQDEGYNVKVQGYGLFYDINADAVELGRFGTPSEASDTPSQVAYCGSIPRGPSFHDWIITKNGQGNFACWLDGVKKSTGSDTTFNTATAMFGVRGYNASGDASSYFYLTDIQYSSDVYGEGGGGLAAMLKLGLSNGGTETPGADASGTPPLIPAPTAGRYKLANVCSPMAPIMPVTTAVRNGDIWEDPTYR